MKLGHIDVFEDVDSEFDNSFLKISPKNNSLKYTFIKGVFEVADSELGNCVLSNSIPKTLYMGEFCPETQEWFVFTETWF